MKKTILILTLLYFNLNAVTAQEVFSKINTKIKSPTSKNCVSIIDKEENIFTFFIGKNLIQYNKISPQGKTLFTKEFSLANNQVMKNSKGTRFSLFGYLLEGKYITADNMPTLLFSNSYRTGFYTIVFPSDGEGTPKLESFIIPSKNKKEKEKHLTSISGKDRVFIYKYVKNSSIVKAYEVSKTVDKISTLDFSGENFYNKQNKRCQLSDIWKLRKKENPLNIMSFGQNFMSNSILNYSFNSHFGSEMYQQKDINYNNSLPSSIEIASEKVKFYAVGNHHIITLNHRPSATRIISINANNQDTEVSHINISMREFSNENSQNNKVVSNSFIYKDKIYQFTSSSQRLHLSAYDLGNKKLIKEYKFTKDEDLTILNAPIRQKGGTYAFGTERTLKKTSQLLRKLTRAKHSGLFVYEDDGKLNLVLGGYTEKRTASIGFGPVATTNNISLPNASGGFTTHTITSFSQPIFNTYSSYSACKSVKANCLFDIQTFEHIEGNTKDNIFDKASENAERIKNNSFFRNILIETIFKYKNFFIQGHYDKKNKQYIYYKLD